MEFQLEKLFRHCMNTARRTICRKFYKDIRCHDPEGRLHRNFLKLFSSSCNKNFECLKYQWKLEDKLLINFRPRLNFKSKIIFKI